jgi:uncharacterized OB-fold protein
MREGSEPVPDASGRMLPALTPATGFFSTSGTDGRLRILCCSDCGRFTHPPGPVCRWCLSSDVTPTDVSGRGAVFTFTVNEQPWSERLSEAYVIAIVELVEQPGLRLLAKLVDCAPVDVRIGMPVEVGFEPVEEVFIPFFRPVFPTGAVSERARR